MLRIDQSGSRPSAGYSARQAVGFLPPADAGRPRFDRSQRGNSALACSSAKSRGGGLRGFRTPECACAAGSARLGCRSGPDRAADADCRCPAGEVGLHYQTRAGRGEATRSVNRDSTAPGPRQLWVADGTYVAAWSGFAHVAFVTEV